MEKKRMPTMKKLLIVVIVIAILCILGALFSKGDTSQEYTTANTESEEIVEENQSIESSSDTMAKNDTQETPTETEENAEPVVIEYDTLQKIFLTVSDSFTEADLVAAIEENDLSYTSKEYTGSNSLVYKIAYNEDVSTQSHADTGSYLQFHFDTDTNALNYAEYVIQTSSGSIAVYFNYDQSGSLYSYTDFSSSPVLRDDGSKSGVVEQNYWEAGSLEEALISALTIRIG